MKIFSSQLKYLFVLYFENYYDIYSYMCVYFFYLILLLKIIIIKIEKYSNISIIIKLK